MCAEKELDMAAFGGRRMASAHPHGRLRWIPLAWTALSVSLLVTGCGNSTPAYCTDADKLKSSLQQMGKVDISKNGLSSLQTAVTSVESNANALVQEARSAFAPQTKALQDSLSGLKSAVESVASQPSVAALQSVKSSLTKVQSSASALESAVSSKCS